MIDRKLRIIYSNCNPMNPSKEMAEFGVALAKSALTTFHLLCGQDSHVAMGYYNSDMKTEIGYLGLDSSSKVLFFNVYVMEYIVDYLIFLKRKDDVSFRYFYAKYMRHIELNSGNDDAASMYNWIFTNAERQIGKPSVEEYEKAAALSLFLIFHELVHQKESWIKPFIDDLEDNKEMLELPELSQEEKIEIGCDTIALTLFDYLGLYERFGIGREEMVSVSSDMILLTGFYRSLSGFTIEMLNGSDDTHADLLKVVSEQERRTSVVLKMIRGVQKGNSFVDCDLHKVIQISMALPELMEHLVRFITYGINDLANEFRKLPDEERKRFLLFKNTKTWYYYI